MRKTRLLAGAAVLFTAAILVGTSGTILSLGAVAAAEEDGAAAAPLRNRRVPAKQLRRVRRTLTSLAISITVALNSLK